MRHAVIVAGGVGSRLWPVSRSSSPKQFHALTSQRTLIQETYDRIAKLLPTESIWVVTTEDYKALTTSQLPEIDQARILTEPHGRNTAPAIGLSTLKILEQDPEAIIGCFPADHYIGKADVFETVVLKEYEYIEKNPDYLSTIGINPTSADTGYGYIKLGEQLIKDRNYPVYQVDKFVEKPSIATAKKYFESWEYLWNGGYYFFLGATLIKHFSDLHPETLESLSQYLKSNDRSIYEKIISQPIDVAIAEKIDQLAVIPADLDWSDLGNWATLQSQLRDKEGSAKKKSHIGVDSTNVTVLAGNRLIATVGVEDMIIIDTNDAILICNKNKVQKVKDVVTQLWVEHKDKV